VNMVDVSCVTCLVLPAKMSKPDLCEPTNWRHRPQVVSDAPLFLEEKSLVQMNLKSLSQNSHCLFWYHLGVCRQHGSHVSSI
jgi:hypothetical protein